MFETELWNEFRGGCKVAYQRIYQLYVRDLLNYGNKVTGNTQLIEDCVQDLFIELWQQRKNLGETNSIKFYLFRALRNKINDSQRKDIFYNSVDYNDDCTKADDFLIETYLIGLEQEEKLLLMLRNSYGMLSYRQQQALNLRFYMDFNNDEVAQIMGINYQSACKFIYSGLKSLRETVKILSIISVTNFLLP
jgi:RNA polymerase sigma factor (sigma-70 family)